jgi:reactive intermediate/imine deaminase
LKKEAVKTGQAPLGLPFSPGIRLGEFLFVSGQGPFDQNGRLEPGDVKVQTRKTLENFRKVVEAGGSKMDDVVQTTVYLKDLSDFQGMNEIYSGFFSDPKPARTTVQAELLFGMKVEVQGIAYVAGKQKG